MATPSAAVLPQSPTPHLPLPQTRLAGLHSCLLKTDLLSPPKTSAFSSSLCNALIRSQPSHFALLFFSELLRLHFPLTSHSFPFLLRSCSSLRELQQLHALALKSNFLSDLYTSNSLLRSYGGVSATAARKLFDRMPDRDSVSWNTMMTIEDTLKIFDEMPERDKNVISWTTALNWCVNGGFPERALEMFREMQITGIHPDAAAISAAVSACAELGALDHGRWLATFVYRNHIAVDSTLACAMVDMFAKCGDSEAAMTAFGAAKLAGAATVHVWTAAINSLALDSRAAEALALFEDMAAVGPEPNELTITAALMACSYSGKVERGKEIFSKVDGGEFPFRPTVEHLCCMAHLLARAGKFQEAKEMAERAGDSAVALGAVLAACRLLGEHAIGTEVGKILLEVDSFHGGRYVDVAKILTGEGKTEEAAEVRKVMKDRKVKKLPGCSSITIAGEVHEFVAGDLSHERAAEIYVELGRMMEKLNQEGYVPVLDRNLGMDMSKEEADVARRGHSERLALGLGLISTEKGTEIRIMKNLRVCEDCHAVFKLASRIYGRKIVMRDRSRFHCFTDGVCSCGDFW